MQTFGVGIVGTGWVSGEYIRSFEANPHTHIAALCGRTEESAMAKAGEWHLDCAIYTDFEKMVAEQGIDIIVITSPPHLHREHAVAAAEAGKHIVLEKAMATSLEDCRAIRDAVAVSGVKSVVSFVLRWNPLFDMIKAQLAQETIGNVFYGEVDYFHGIHSAYKQFSWNVTKKSGGSSLLSAGCHAVDALRWFMGGDVAEVYQYRTRGGAGDFAKYEYDPTTVTILQFADGRAGKVTSCIECVQPYVFNINLVGTDGTIKNNRIFSRKAYPRQTSWAEVPTIMPDSGDVTHHPFQGEVDHLVHCILEDIESHTSVADALKTHEIVFAADQSGLEGKPVKVPTS